jgi:peptidoglycan/xylan/chitin deacetylase (PgdA/CDA1 family)
MRLLAALVLAALPVNTPPSTLLWEMPTSAHTMALTFDAGADRGYASQILSILERTHVRASFGMTGRWAEANKDLVRKMVRDGDVLMNHTYDHRSFTGYSSSTAPLTTRQRMWEINSTEAAIRKITGTSTRPYFRPPYGDYDGATLTLARRLGYRYTIMWTIDTLGWNHATPAQILARCLDGARPGAIVMMHVGIQSLDVKALPDVISGLRARHYRLVTIAQVVRRT